MRRTTAAAVICLALTVFHTWPIASAPQRESLNYNADAELTAWIVSWIAHALPHEPQRLFAGNIFQPNDRVLSYSEPLIVPALVGTPIRWAGGSPVLTFNLLMMLGLALTAFAGWWVVDRWTGSFWAGLASAALVAFNTHFLTRLPHLQAMHAWQFPLAFYLTDRVLAARDGRDQRRSALLLAVVVAAAAMTSVYTGFLVGLMVAIQAAIGVRSRPTLGALALAGAVAVLFASPVVFLYGRLAGEGVRRTLEDAAQFAATPGGYLTSMSRLHAGWSHRFFSRDVDVLFPGIAALSLAVVGAWDGLRQSADARRRTWALLAIAAVGFVLSLGPATPIYRAAFQVILPMQALRVPARFGYLPLFAVAMLAGFGVAAVVRPRARGAAAAIGVAALAAVTIEAWHGRVPTVPFAGVPRIYAVLDLEPKPVLLVETPFWHPDVVYGNAEYVLNASDNHAPIMNGYSGLTPDLYRKRAQWFWFFPEPWAIEAMRTEGATHVMVHLEQFAAEAEKVKAVLDKQRELELIAEDPRGHRLYRFSKRQ